MGMAELRNREGQDSGLENYLTIGDNAEDRARLLTWPYWPISRVVDFISASRMKECCLSNEALTKRAKG